MVWKSPVPRRTLIVAALAANVSGACASAQTQPQKSPAQQLLLFQYSPGPAFRPGAPLREQKLASHGAYMQQLLDEGRLFAGGGYASEDGGMAIVRAASLEEARAMLDADPAIVTGVFVADLRQWRPRFRTDQPLPSGR